MATLRRVTQRGGQRGGERGGQRGGQRRTRAAHNAFWLIGDRLFRMVVSVTIGIWMARYLGPTDYGLLSFGIAAVTIAGALVGLGMQEVLVQKLVSDQDNDAKLLGSALLMTFMAGIAATALLFLMGPALRPDDASAQALIAVLSLTLAFRAIEPLKFWFESRVESRYVVFAESGVLLLMACVRVTLIVTGQPVIAFAIALLIEAVITALAISTIFALRYRARLRPAAAVMKELATASFPLLLAGIAIVLYMRVDQVMLGQMIDDYTVGVYSVAVRISELWYFVPTAIVSSVFPFIISERQSDSPTFRLRLHQLYAIMIVISIGAAIPLSLVATPVIQLLFGIEYVDAGAILAIHVWAGVFVALGTARGRWLVLHDLQRFSLYYVGIGMIINILLNLLLIPSMGGVGAAIATLIAQFCSVILIPLLIPQTRISVIDFAIAIPRSLAALRVETK